MWGKGWKFRFPCYDNAVYICEYIDNKIKRNHCSVCALCRWGLIWLFMLAGWKRRGRILWLVYVVKYRIVRSKAQLFSYERVIFDVVFRCRMIIETTSDMLVWHKLHKTFSAVPLKRKYSCLNSNPISIRHSRAGSICLFKTIFKQLNQKLWYTILLFLIHPSRGYWFNVISHKSSLHRSLFGSLYMIKNLYLHITFYNQIASPNGTKVTQLLMYISIWKVKSNKQSRKLFCFKSQRSFNQIKNVFCCQLDLCLINWCFRTRTDNILIFD